jgi:hypothetical protein
MSILDELRDRVAVDSRGVEAEIRQREQHRLREVLVRNSKYTRALGAPSSVIRS